MCRREVEEGGGGGGRKRDERKKSVHCVLVPRPHMCFMGQYGLGTRCTWCILCTVRSIWGVCTCVAKCIVLHCVQ